MSVSLSVTEASRDFPAAIGRALASADGVLLLDAGKPVAKLLPIRRRAKTGREIAANWPARPHLSPADAEALGRDIGEARRCLLPVRDSWA